MICMKDDKKKKKTKNSNWELKFSKQTKWKENLPN